MRGRTNVGGAGGAEIYADTELFTVAEGSNVIAGNFVQYKLESDNRKYDTQYGGTENSAPKILPLGNGKYVRRYKNATEENTTWFNLVDVNEGFNLLSAFSINNEYIPAFCLLNDGNLAVCYMKKDNAITIKIYELDTSFLQIFSYEFENDSIGNAGWLHVAQSADSADSKIVITNGTSYGVYNYENAIVTEAFYGAFSFTGYNGMRKFDNDYNLCFTEENKFLVFPSFYTTGSAGTKRYGISLCSVEENGIKEIEINEISESNEPTGFRNNVAWGNAFGILGKVLYTYGGTNDLQKAYQTKIYYEKNNSIMGSSIFDLASEAGILIGSYTNEVSAQYVKENVFYVSLSDSKTDKCYLYRVEYNEHNGTFTKSNIVQFEYSPRFGYGQFFEGENGDVYYLYEIYYTSGENQKKNGRWLMKLSYKDGVLSIGESTGLVENYNASGAAIGVAKQSGSAGQKVEVYVPKV